MLAQKLILSYGSKLFIQFIEITASIVVARIAGPTVLGTVAFGVAFVSVFAFIADLGIGTAHVKFVSEGQEIGKCISTFSVLKIFNTMLFFIIVLGIFLLQKYALNVQFESAAHEQVILIALMTVTIGQLLLIPKITFAGKTEQAKQDIPEFVSTLIYQFLRIIIVLLGYRAVALAFGNLISTIIVIPFILYLFKDYPRDRFDKKLASKYLKVSLPIFIIGMSSGVIFYLDKVMLQYFTNSEQVGYYAAGYRIGGFLLIIANSVGMLFFPTFSKAASEGNYKYIKRTIERFEGFSFVFIMPLVIFFSIYSDSIIKVVLGKQYLPSVPVMVFINFAMFIMILGIPYGNIITGMGFFKLGAIINVFNLVFFIISLSLFLNPKVLNLGAKGAAIAVLLSALFINILFRIFAKRKCDILDLRKYIKLEIFGICNFVGFYFLYNMLSKIYGNLFKILFIAIYFGLTYLVLLLLGWLNKERLNDLREIARLKEVTSYIKGELRLSGRNDSE